MREGAASGKIDSIGRRAYFSSGNPATLQAQIMIAGLGRWRDFPVGRQAPQ